MSPLQSPTSYLPCGFSSEPLTPKALGKCVQFRTLATQEHHFKSARLRFQPVRLTHYTLVCFTSVFAASAHKLAFKLCFKRWGGWIIMNVHRNSVLTSLAHAVARLACGLNVVHSRLTACQVWFNVEGGLDFAGRKECRDCGCLQPVENVGTEGGRDGIMVTHDQPSIFGFSMFDFASSSMPVHTSTLNNNSAFDSVNDGESRQAQVRAIICVVVIQIQTPLRVSEGPNAETVAVLTSAKLLHTKSESGHQLHPSPTSPSSSTIAVHVRHNHNQGMFGRNESCLKQKQVFKVFKMQCDTDVRSLAIVIVFHDASRIAYIRAALPPTILQQSINAQVQQLDQRASPTTFDEHDRLNQSPQRVLYGRFDPGLCKNPELSPPLVDSSSPSLLELPSPLPSINFGSSSACTRFKLPFSINFDSDSTCTRLRPRPIDADPSRACIIDPAGLGSSVEFKSARRADGLGRIRATLTCLEVGGDSRRRAWLRGAGLAEGESRGSSRALLCAKAERANRLDAAGTTQLLPARHETARIRRSVPEHAATSDAAPRALPAKSRHVTSAGGGLRVGCVGGGAHNGCGVTCLAGGVRLGVEICAVRLRAARYQGRMLKRVLRGMREGWEVRSGCGRTVELVPATESVRTAHKHRPDAGGCADGSIAASTVTHEWYSQTLCGEI
ncbi:hypothetical protein C8R43DRAFT_953080 [Mycena crocata]|nr:hypothetical protein C8R43DRAFT_953080 [Mycena crocata]